ncbi:recombinase family protein [Microbacterium sp.]|uniref:recombinase family protein n=1 Tax=Microbacterium sp. TaxID=51671 RepID=UPI0037C923ED
MTRTGSRLSPTPRSRGKATTSGQLRGVDSLVVRWLDRLSRDARSACVVVEVLRERGVALRSAAVGLDSSLGPLASSS